MWHMQEFNASNTNKYILGCLQNTEFIETV